MANLVSPGVQVTVIDESFYASAGPGTVPLIVIATRSNKPSPTGTGIAPGTVQREVNKPFVATSQRELIQTFGNPTFVTVQGTPVHGHELNEYGLHAAYQYLGINNRAYVMRSDIDLAQLDPSVSAPRGEPLNGTYWFDLSETQFGVFQSTGAVSLDPFLKQNVIVVSNPDEVDQNTGKPLSNMGNNGDFAIVTAEGTNRVFEKVPTTTTSLWLNVGSRAWTMARSFVRGSQPAGTVTVGNSFNLNNVTIVLNSTNLGQIVNDINDTILNSPVLSDLTDPANPIPYVIASVDSSGILKFNFVLPSISLVNVTGTPLTDLNLPSGTFNSTKLSYAPHNKVPQSSVAGDVWIKTTSLNGGAKYVIKFYNATQGQFVTMAAPFYANDAAASTALGSNPQIGTLYVQFNPEGTQQVALAGQILKRWNGSVWEQLSYEQDEQAPTTDPEDGTLWYNVDFRADIMVNDGDQWVGYRKMYPDSDPNGVALMSVAPLAQSDETPLVDNDLWLDTSDLENYPALYRYNAASRRWTKVDNTDQTTPFGIVFADARENSGPSYMGASNDYIRNSEEMKDMTLSNFLDPDCVDPRTYTAGCLLFNTRFSTYNVKEWKPEWFTLGGFDANTDFTFDSYEVGGGFYNDNGQAVPIRFPALEKAGRWVTTSGNMVDGSPYMGRKAQRIMIVKALSATVAANEDIRSELVYFNLIAVPGYPELLDEMILLNTDKKEVSFIVGDTPARLAPNGTAIQRWATNANNAASNGENGLTSSNPYIGLYYPWGLTTNYDGNEIMVPPSTIALRTMAYNDQVSYPWFAPAGFTRGLVTNATSVGYLTEEGEYAPVILNQGQRDVLYTNKINPIAYIPNRGLVVYGQKTLNPLESALDRVNVARLTNYMRYNLDNLAKPFLFEQNDSQTRDSFRVTIERFLMGLVGQRALEDFLVVCDESNNTPERRDRNELWADIVIQPIKAVEFIYLPIRIRNSGDSLEL